VSDSYGFQWKVFYIESHLTPQYPLYTTFPELCGRLLESDTAPFENGVYKCPSRSSEFVLSGLKFSLVNFLPISTKTLINSWRPQTVMWIRNNRAVYFHHLPALKKRLMVTNSEKWTARAKRGEWLVMYNEIHSLYFFGQLSIISQYIHFSRPSSISLQYLQLKIEVRAIRSS